MAVEDCQKRLRGTNKMRFEPSHWDKKEDGSNI
jgi:hypothetical protein